jgi:DNA-directed RNA polymerase subunit omega
MARITIEDCTERVENRFALVLMSAIRTKQLMRGARPLVRAEENRPVVVSLREIAAQLVTSETPEPSN